MTGDGMAAARRIGEQRKDRVISRGAQLLRDEFPGIGVRAEPDAIALTGRGLLRRWINDARLRAIGSLLK